MIWELGTVVSYRFYGYEEKNMVLSLLYMKCYRVYHKVMVQLWLILFFFIARFIFTVLLFPYLLYAIFNYLVIFNKYLILLG